MKNKLDSNHLGFVLGITFALFHAVWALLVGIGIADNILNYIVPLHFVSATFSILSFNFTNVIVLLFLSFLGGYLVGFVFAEMWNLFSKK